MTPQLSPNPLEGFDQNLDSGQESTGTTHLPVKDKIRRKLEKTLKSARDDQRTLEPLNFPGLN